MYITSRTRASSTYLAATARHLLVPSVLCSPFYLYRAVEPSIQSGHCLSPLSFTSARNLRSQLQHQKMAGPRLTAPTTKLVRSISTKTTTTVTQSTTLLTSSKTSAPLSRKYAELLKERNIDPDHPRHLYTRSSNRPHPPPRTMRLMQTFSSSASRSALADVSTMDNIVFPGSASFEGSSNDPFARLRVPLLPDNFIAHHAPDVSDGPVSPAQISIVAANPELVSPSALTEVEGMSMDGVELKFIHEEEASEQEPGMLTDLWKGLVDDVLGNNSKSNVAL
ncbi:hypothetical protein GGR54DRAFT_593190 [Hypoxylon sp. NC1633]|nr:hypothetical protein GGR54DRAFT_593190 [Hypoxylon sp. NC1633]